MWNSSTFGGGNEGGFLSTNETNSPAATKGKGTPRLQSVVPVCVRQLMEHPDEDFTLFGVAAQIVVIVGILREYEVQSTKVTYEIEDHTGRITAVYWLENDTQKMAPNLPDVKEGRYCQIFGSVRTTAGKRMVMILKIFEVDDLNVTTSHLLQVIRARLEAESLGKSGGSLAKIKANHPGAELANSMSFMDSDMDSNKGSSRGLTPIQQKVYKILQTATTENGLSRGFVLQSFPPHQHRDANNALDFLSFEGHVYTTIDNDHFMATDSM